jgi:hypothetical protein
VGLGNGLAGAFLSLAKKTVVDLGCVSQAAGASDGVDGDCEASMRQ